MQPELIKTVDSDIIQFKYFTLLSTLHASILLIAVILDYRFIKVGPLFASSATFIISITFFLADVITEVYGYQKTRQVIWSSLLCLIVVTTICFVINQVKTPSEYSKYGEAYTVILDMLPRAGFANAFAVFLGLFFNSYIISKWKILTKGKYFWLRSIASSAVGEIIFTILVVSLVNFGVVPFPHLIQILIVSYSFKLIFNFFISWPTWFLTIFLKKAECVDAYDNNINYNPFAGS